MTVHDRVIVGFDLSPDAAAALEWAAVEAELRGSELVVVHAFAPVRQSTDDETAVLQAKLREADRRDIDDRLNAVSVARPGLRVKRHYVSDLPARALASFSGRVDLLVVGAGGGGSGARMGTTPRACLRRPQCPVAVIAAGKT
jgi:nucleotide-binding universal stress UspA family protein